MSSRVVSTIGEWEQRSEGDGSGRVFYYNVESGESTWDAPLCFEKGDDVEAEGEVRGDWVESFNEEHGLPFYFNTRTGESLWEKPAEWFALASAGATDAEDDGASSDDDDESGTTDDSAEAVDEVDVEEREADAALAARPRRMVARPSIDDRMKGALTRAQTAISRRRGNKKEARIVTESVAIDLEALEGSLATYSEAEMVLATTALRRSFLLSPAVVSEAQIRLLVRAMPTRTLARGDTLYREHASGPEEDCAFVVKAGSCFAELTSLQKRGVRRRRSSTGSYGISAQALEGFKRESTERSGSVDDDARRAMVQSFKEAASGMGSLRRVGGFGGVLAGAGTPRSSTPSAEGTPRGGANTPLRTRPTSARLTPSIRRKIRTPSRTYVPGDLVGEIALIHSVPRDASIFASDDACADVPGGQGSCEVWVLPRLLLRQVLAATRSSGVSAARGSGAAAGRRGGVSLGSVVAAAQQQQQQQQQKEHKERSSLARVSSHAALTRRRSESQMTRAMIRGDLDSAAVLALEQLRTLGEGSFGLVHLAARAGAAGASEPTLYALKVLQKIQVVANRQERQVLAEKEALCILRDRSPFVVHLIGTAQTASRYVGEAPKLPLHLFRADPSHRVDSLLSPLLVPSC